MIGMVDLDVSGECRAASIAIGIALDGELFLGRGDFQECMSIVNTPTIGSTITYRYFELTNDGKPRHPTFVRIRPYE